MYIVLCTNTSIFIKKHPIACLFSFSALVFL